MLPFLDIVLHIIHLSVIIINVFFWIPKKTRKIHLIIMLPTLFSWGALGAIYGWGYCFLTHWHYKVLHELDVLNLPHNYIAYFLNNVLGFSIGEAFIDKMAYMVFGVVVVCSGILHVLDFKNSRANVN